MYQKYSPTRGGGADVFVEQFRTRRFGEGSIAESFHQNSKLTRLNKDKYEGSAKPFLEDDAFLFATERIRPDYENLEKISLPKPDEMPTDTSLFEATRNRRSVREFSPDDVLALEQLSNLLYHSTGTSSRSEESKNFRTYPSAGGLYPIELYFVLTTSVGDLDPGTYFYVPDDHAVRVIRPDNSGGEISDLFADSDSFDYSAPELTVFLTASFGRSSAKYGPRGYRYVLLEAGHVGQNLQLVATALGLGSVVRGSYLDDRVNDHLRIDGVNEATVSAITVGSSSESGDLA